MLDIKSFLGGISTHVPHKRYDDLWSKGDYAGIDFNSRTSQEVRHIDHLCFGRIKDFNSRTSQEVRQDGYVQIKVQDDFNSRTSQEVRLHLY